MAKKKTPSAAAKKQFIAIDNSEDLVISKGCLEDVRQVLDSYVQEEDYSIDDIDEYIEVYELAELKKVRTFHRAPEIIIES